MATVATPSAAAAASPARARRWHAGAGILSAATILVSAGNYGFSLLVAHALKPGDFSAYSAAQALLLVLGTGCMAAIPWAMARSMALADTPRARQEALHFGLRATLVQGLLAAPVAGIILGLVAGPAVGLVTGLGALSLSLVAAPIGFLQGEGDVNTIAALRVAEWAVRVTAGLAAVLLITRSGALALVGFPIGSALLFVLALRACRRGFPLRRGDPAAVRVLVRASISLGAVQVALSALGAVDAIAAEASGFDGATRGSYQVAAMLGRIPLFVSTAVALAAYTAIARARDDRAAGPPLGEALALYAAVAVPTLVACWTVPAGVLHLVVPSAYTSVASLLRWTSLAGVAVGLVDVLTTAHQARERCGAALRLIAPIAIVEPVALIVAGRVGGREAFVVVLVALTACAALLVSWDARRWRPVGFAVPWPGWLIFAAGAGEAALSHSVVPWVLAVLAMFAATGGRAAMRLNAASATR